MLIVDVPALRRVGAEIVRATDVLRSTLDDLEADIRPLIGAWSGDAQRAYAGRREAWRSAAEDLAALLSEVGRAVDESAADYLDTETRNRALFD